MSPHAPVTIQSLTPLAILGQSDYRVVGILILTVTGLALAIMAVAHLVGPKRKGPIKDSTYESGMDPVGDARRRFNVRFYVVAMLFLLFDVEIVFFYPWATLFPRLSVPAGATQKDWTNQMTTHGFGSGFMLMEMFVFVAILLVGYVYAWKKGAFKWN